MNSRTVQTLQNELGARMYQRENLPQKKGVEKIKLFGGKYYSQKF